MANDPGITPYVPSIPTGGYSTNLLGGSSGSTAVEPSIFAGWNRTPTPGVDVTGGNDQPIYKGGFTVKTPVYLTAAQFLSAFDQMDRDRFLKIRNMFIAAKLVPEDADAQSVRSAFAGVLGELKDMAALDVHMSPMGYVRNLIRLNGLDPSEISNDEDFTLGGPTDPNRREVDIRRQVTEIAEGEAWSSLQAMLSSMTGRDPSDQETRDFVYRMNRLAASNPAISKTVTQYKNGEAVSTSTHLDPGLTTADMAQEAYETAQNTPGYAEYQGASTYFNAALDALGPLGG